MKKPQHKRSIGKRIVDIKQRWIPAEPGRPGAWHVEAIILEDGSALRTLVGEHDGEYSVELVRSPKSKS